MLQVVDQRHRLAIDHRQTGARRGQQQPRAGGAPGPAGRLLQLGDQPHQPVARQQPDVHHQPRPRAVQQRRPQPRQRALHQALQVEPVARGRLRRIGAQHDRPVHPRRRRLRLQRREQQRIHAQPLQIARPRAPETAQQLGLGPLRQPRRGGEHQQPALAPAALQARLHLGGVGQQRVVQRRRAVAQPGRQAREGGGETGRGAPAEQGAAIGAVMPGGGGVPVQRRAGFFEQPVQRRPLGQRRRLGVAAPHPRLQIHRPQLPHTHQRAQRLPQRLQRGHAARIQLLPTRQRRPPRRRRRQPQQPPGRQHQGRPRRRHRPRPLQAHRQGHAFQRLQHPLRRQQRIGRRAGVRRCAQLARVVRPGRRAGDQRRAARVVVRLEAGRLQVRLGLDRRPQHRRGQPQPLHLVPRRTAAQAQQRQGGLLRAHHLSLAHQQRVELDPQFGERGGLEPALAGLEHGGGQRAAHDVARLGRFAQRRPAARRHRVVQPEVMGQRRFLRPVVPGRAAWQQQRGQLVDADSAVGRLVGVVRGVPPLGQVGAQPGQFLGREPDLLAHPVAHAAQVAELDPIHRQQLARVVDAHAVEHLLRRRAVAQLGHRGAQGDGRGQCGQPGLRIGRGRVQRGAGGEDRVPGAQHLLGVVVAFARVAPQRAGEEGAQPVAHDRVEHLALDGGLDLQHGRRGPPVAPDRWLADRHLVQRHRQREAFGVQVPARRPAQRQEGVEVGRRAGGQVGQRRAAQREVEQHELQLAGAGRADADVLGLDVAVRDALALQVVHRLDQLAAEALQQVQRQPALVAQQGRQRLLARVAQQQRGAPGDAERLAVGDDVLVVQPGQHLAFGHQPLVVRDIQRHLEHEVFVTAVAAHQQRVAG